jgi:hypothetical protein
LQPPTAVVSPVWSIRRYAGAVTTVVGRSAIPYGYTITIWTSGAAIESSQGTPTVGDAFLFLVGAIAGFAFVGLIAAADHDPPLDPEGGELIRTGLFQIVAVGLAFGAAALVGVMHNLLVWPAAAFAATLTYLAVAAIELFVVAKGARRREPWPH